MEINSPIQVDSRRISPKIFRKTRLLYLIFVFITIAISLAGCATFTDYDTSQEYTSDPVSTVDALTSLGQTFISRRPRLNSITIWISVPENQDTAKVSIETNPISVNLFHSPGEATPVFSTVILAPTSGNNLPVNIGIPDQNNPAGQGYYLLLTKETGSVQVNGRNEDAYPQGQAYVNGQEINADIAFRLSYNYDVNTLVQDIEQSLPFVWLAFPLLGVLWLPGWLLIELTGIRRQLDFGEQTGMAIGISLALVPVIMLWTTILRIRWTQRGVLFCVGFLAALFCIRAIYVLFFEKKKTIQGVDQATGKMTQAPERVISTHASALALLSIFTCALAVRLVMVRDLATPAWVDSVHHALITRLILSEGSYPASYLPYWDFSPTAYHPGFHSVAAAFTWLSHLNLNQSLLILGQVLNTVTVFSVYLLAKILTKSTSIGLIAALITGFVTPMPAYYTSWGRYTELAGLLILPVGFVLVKLLIETQSAKRRYWLILLGGLTTGGLFMVHYRVILFLGCLILTYLAINLPGNKIHPFNQPLRVLTHVFIVTVAGILLVSPWLIQTVKSTVLPWIRSSPTTVVPFFQDFSWAYLTAALGKQSLVLAGLGLFWGMIKRLRFGYLVLIWVTILFFFANLGALHMPGSSLVNNTSVEIMLFMPLSVLGGYFIEQIAQAWRSLIPKLLVIPYWGIFIIVLGWMASTGAKQLMTIINPVTVLSRNADLPAIQWISQNIPENETIVINPFPWGYGLFAGNDGGYWISPLTGRKTLPPPVLYGMGSEGIKINTLSQKVIDLNSDAVAFKELLSANQIHYVYIGAKGGVISPQKLSNSGLFNLLYHKDDVWIFRVKP